MLFGSSFQSSSAICWLCNFPGRLPSPPNGSHDSPEATPAGLTLQRFRLLRFRSPLLTQSNFFLFLRVLRWFTSPGSLLHPMNSDEDSRCSHLLGFPIRKSPDHSLLAASRGLSQLTTSFIARLRQGIHTHALSSLTIKSALHTKCS